MAGNSYKVKITLSDGSVKELPFTAPQGPQGPQGEKGDSRGITAHYALTAGDLYDLITNLTVTQEIAAIVSYYRPPYDGKFNHTYCFAMSFKSDRQIRPGNPPSYTLNFSYHYPMAPTAEGDSSYDLAITSASDATKFKVPLANAPDANGLVVYIYDSSTPSDSELSYTKEETNALLAKKVSYLRLADDGILPQAKIPAYSSVGDIPTDMAAFQSAFSTGSFEFTYGLVLDCFAFIGGTLCSVKVSADSESTIYVEGQTALEDGAVVCMYSQYTEGYVNYQVIESSSTGSKNIFDTLYPQNCRFPLEIDSTSNPTAVLDKMSNLSIVFKKYGGSSNSSIASLYLVDCKDIDVRLDCSGLAKDSNGNTIVALYMEGKNAVIPSGSQYLGTTGSYTDGIQRFRIVDGNWDSENKTVEQPPFGDTPTMLDLNGIPTLYQYFFVRQGNYWTFESGRSIRRDLTVSLIGYEPVITRPFEYEDAPASASSLAATPMMVKAMSSEPGLTQEDFNEIIKDKKGIFTIKDNMAYNLLTGEYLM